MPLSSGQTKPKTYFLEVEGTRLAAYEWAPRMQNSQSPQNTVLLLHATGFHARCWDQVIRYLADDWRVLALDARGHGRSQAHPPYQWSRFADDLSACVDLLNLKGVVGVGHSMGGHCLASVAADHPDVFDRLLLIDPVIFAPQMYDDVASMIVSVEDHPVARRRNHFASWQAMFERFENRHPYSLWQREVLEDYCRYGVVQIDSGGVELACSGLVEASIYVNNFTTDIHAKLASITMPVDILRAPPGDADSVEADFAASPTWPELASAFSNARDIYLPDLTHFIPMQDPELVARYIQAAEL